MKLELLFYFSDSFTYLFKFFLEPVKHDKECLDLGGGVVVRTSENSETMSMLLGKRN